MRLAFVDLETTGGSPVEDCITEVGIIEVDLDENDPTRPPSPVREWSALVRPDAPIPPFIETLTGISNAMVADAPRFEDLAHDILARLEGRLFIAHNARFDHGFLKNAFRRLGHPFRPSVLCTVRLSRKLYPGYSRHNLDTLIERHRLVVDMRHRALGDARLLWQLWQKLHAALPGDQITAAIDQLTARPSLPRHLDPDVLDTLPKTAGVYLFHGEPTTDEKAERAAVGELAEPRPLYVGKAKNLRQRVMAHFTGDHLSAREMEISQQMTGLEWIETGGGTQLDLGALLVEATLVKSRAPAYNRQLRKTEDVCAWRLVVDAARGRWKLALARPDDLFFAQDRDLYGPFATPRQASVALRAIADAHGLCPSVLKLDKAQVGKPCFSHQVKRCRGACVGLETIAEHTGRLREALASTALVPWPFPGAVAFREGRTFHVVDGWAYLGMASDLDGARRLASTTRLFDHDVYRLLVRRIDALEVVRLDPGAPVTDVAAGEPAVIDVSPDPTGRTGEMSRSRADALPLSGSSMRDPRALDLSTPSAADLPCDATPGLPEPGSTGSGRTGPVPVALVDAGPVRRTSPGAGPREPSVDDETAPVGPAITDATSMAAAGPRSSRSAAPASASRDLVDATRESAVDDEVPETERPPAIARITASSASASDAVSRPEVSTPAATGNRVTEPLREPVPAAGTTRPAAAPVDATQANATPADATPVEAAPVDAAAADAAPADAALADAAPADAAPADAAPVDATQANATPADATPADAMPADGMPADAMPADVMPADGMPADVMRADAMPADATPTDATPTDATQANVTPAEAMLPDTTVPDTMPPDAVSLDAVPAYRVPADAAPGNAVPADATPADAALPDTTRPDAPYARPDAAPARREADGRSSIVSSDLPMLAAATDDD